MTKTSQIIIALLILQVVSASWKVSLQSSKLIGTVTLSDQTTRQVQADELHVSTVSLGTGDFSKKVDAMFDTTSLTNWFIDEQTQSYQTLSAADKQNIYSCKTPCKFDDLNGVPITYTHDNLQIFGDRFQLTSNPTTVGVVGRNATDKVVFSNQKTVNSIPFLVPNDITLNPTPQVALNLKSLGKTTASFGLGHPEYVDRHQSNFVDRVNQNGEKLQKKGFSFYIHDTISQILFGEPEKFFGDKPQAIRNLDETTQYWKTKLVQLQVGGTVVGRSSPTTCRNSITDTTTTSYATSLPCTPTSSPPGEAQPFAVFDSTTKFIYAPKGQIDVLVEEMGQRDAGKTFRFNSTVNLYEAPCQKDHLDSQFPELEFYFFEVDQPFKVKGSDYVTYDSTKTSKNCWLNIKPNTETNRPANSQYIWYLGTTFFRANYCHFDQATNYINCSPAFRFTPQNKTIGDQARLFALVIGALILLGALAVLISLFTQVPPFQTSSIPAPSPSKSQNIELGRTKIERSLPAPVPISNSVYQPQPQFTPFTSQFARNY